MQVSGPPIGSVFWETSIGRSFVPALINHKQPYQSDGGEEVGWITSGFVVELDGTWFWITAQHSLDALEERMRDRSDVGVQFRALTDPQAAEIFIAYDADYRLDWARTSREALESATLDDQEAEAHRFFSSLDIGALALTELTVRNLQAAGIRPLTLADSWIVENHRITQDSVDAALYGVAGIPMNSIRLGEDKKPELWHYKVLPLGLIDDSGPINRFKPLWTDADHVGSVKGMSGGPVFMLFEGSTYWIGVQSAEINRTGRPKELHVCPARLVLELLSKIAEAMDALRLTDGGSHMVKGLRRVESTN